MILYDMNKKKIITDASDFFLRINLFEVSYFVDHWTNIISTVLCLRFNRGVFNSK